MAASHSLEQRKKWVARTARERTLEPENPNFGKFGRTIRVSGTR